MFIGIRQLRRTRDLLGFNGRPSDRDLSEAMLSFWAACELRHDWPSGFAARAEEIRLLTLGPRRLHPCRALPPTRPRLPRGRSTKERKTCLRSARPRLR